MSSVGRLAAAALALALAACAEGGEGGEGGERAPEALAGGGGRVEGGPGSAAPAGGPAPDDRARADRRLAEGGKAAAASAGPAFRTGTGPDALALLIAIAEYGAPPPGMKNARGQSVLAYRPLNADNDVPLVRAGLELHGFRAENIRELRDAAATRDGILAALDALVAAVGPGDVVVIHYSGHGHQLTDDHGPADELDGYDEVLVPHGAPAEFVTGYDGALHLRDDTLGAYVRRLRERAGPAGSVTVFLDACFSGTGTRGGEALPVRGVQEPLGPPNPAAAAAPGTRGGGGGRGSGLDVELPGTRGGGGAAGAAANGLARFAVLSAARHDEVAHETYAADGTTLVGSLSYALSQALPRLRPGDTYSTLFTYVVSALHGRVRQTPQLEGDRDAVVFRPDLVRERAPSVRVAEAREDGRIVLDAGGLVRLNRGSRVSLFPPSGDLAEIEPWARGLVVSGSPTRAVVELDAPAPGVPLREARVVADRLAYGDAALRVALDPALPRPRADSLRALLEDAGMVDLVEANADLVLDDRPAIAPAGVPASRLARRVQDWARNQYLRRLQLEDPRVKVRFDLAVVRWDEASNACTRADWSRAAEHPGYEGGGRWSLPPRTDYVLRVRNEGDEPLHFAVLDLMPPGDTVTLVKPLYPRDEHSAQATELPPGGELQIPETCYYTEESGGLETLKLFVSTDPIPVGRLVGMRTRSGERGGDMAMSATREIHLRIGDPES